MFYWKSLINFTEGIEKGVFVLEKWDRGDWSILKLSHFWLGGAQNSSPPAQPPSAHLPCNCLNICAEANHLLQCPRVFTILHASPRPSSWSAPDLAPRTYTKVLFHKGLRLILGLMSIGRLHGRANLQCSHSLFNKIKVSKGFKRLTNAK